MASLQRDRYGSRQPAQRTKSDQLIDDYVRQLRTSAWIRQLPAWRTEELEDEARAKIESDLAAAGNRDEATVHRVLDRLGPASDMIAAQNADPPAGIHRLVTIALTPLARLRFLLKARGWGIAEVGGLLLLIVGPFLVWWVGPIFGILLIRYAADRWSPRAMRIATGLVFGLLAMQALLAVGTLAFLLVTDGNLDAETTRRMMSGFGSGQLSSATIRHVAIPCCPSGCWARCWRRLLGLGAPSTLCSARAIAARSSIRGTAVPVQASRQGRERCRTS